MRTRRKQPGRFTWGLVAAAVLSGCTDGSPAEPTSTLSPQAALYLDAAVRIMESFSIKKNEIDWAEFRATTFEQAEAISAQTTEDTYPMIVDALERIGDNHSFFQPASTPQQLVGQFGQALRDGPNTADPMSELIEAGVGYIDVPAFSGGGTEGNALALSYHQLIESVDTADAVCRWVVDLRGNTGGNMWPMVAGIGPILGADTIGMFVDPDSIVQTWFYAADGTSGLDEGIIAAADPAYALSSQPNVAVLHDSMTASSGEAVAIAFRGRPASRSFGTETWGVSTANQGFSLSDGAVIFLTVSTMADREGTLYGQRVVPDELVFGAKTGDRATDAALDAAVTWLNAQSCA